jgi:hypothetical protein
MSMKEKKAKLMELKDETQEKLNNIENVIGVRSKSKWTNCA